MEFPQCKPYPPEIQALDTNEGMIKLFWSYLGEFHTNEAAYEAAERFRGIYYNTRKFANYESFRVTLNYLKLNKKPPFGIKSNS